MPPPGQPQPTQAPAPRRGREQLSRRHGLLTARHRPVWQHWREPYLLEPTDLGGTAGPRTSLAEAFSLSV